MNYHRGCEISSTRSTQWTSGPYQDAVYYTLRSRYGWFLNKFDNFSIFRQIWQVRTYKIFHFLENHETRDLEQQCFKSTLPMSYPVDHHVTTLGSSMDGFQQVWQFLIFRQNWQVRTCRVWTNTWDIQHQNPIQDLFKMLFTTLRYDIHSF